MVSFNGFLTVLVAAATITAVYAVPAPASELLILEHLPIVPQEWYQGIAVPATKRLRFRIAIKQESAYIFEQHLLAISDPDHAKYGQHMKRDELKAMLRPSDEASRAILGWLSSQGVPAKNIEDNGDWINFYVTAYDAERILDTEFHYYRNSLTDVERIRTLQYSVPKDLHQYIQMIQPTTRFGQMQRSTGYEHFVVGPSTNSMKQYSGESLNVTFCNTTITPQCLKDLYHVRDFRGSSTNGGKMGICGYLNEYARFVDFSNFTKQYTPYAAYENFTYVSINGGLELQNDTTDDSIEANLDSQYAYPLSYPTPGYYYSTRGLGELDPDLDEPVLADDQNEPYLDFLHYILTLPDDELPTTLSTSYGEDEQSIPEPYTNQTCSLFAQLGARGVSVIFSSGDLGPGSACQTNDGKNTTRFNPTFPGACPFVTSVGGTINVEPEQAAPFSSGGFSDRFPRPSYQDWAVSQYLDYLGDTWKGLYNPNGRGFPDVAAQAANFVVIDHGTEFHISGTSSSAPAFAGIVSLLNSARLSANQKPLGFLNPFIYKYGYRGLNDIVNGKSSGCTGIDRYTLNPAPYVPDAGWGAVEGWDPVTGYGTPNFPILLALSKAYGQQSGGSY